MKQKISLFALLLISFQVFATVTVTPLWERSRALNNAATNVTIDASTNQKTIAVARDTIFLQDNNDGLIYCYSTATGDYLTSFTSPTTDMDLTADDAGNLVSFGPADAVYLKAHLREADGTYSEIDLGATKKVAYPTIIGDIRTKAYVWTFPTIPAGATTAEAYCYEITNKVVSDVKMISLNFLKTLSSRNHFAAPISGDSVVLNMYNGFTAFIDKRNTYSAIGDMGTFIRSNLPVTNTLPTQNGGDYFVYHGRKYYVQGIVGTSTKKYTGAFRIYDVTNPASVSIFYERLTDLGIQEAIAADIMHFQAVVKSDGVYIYQYAPLNGMAAYKLADDTSTGLTDKTTFKSSCYAENGVVKVVAPLGEYIELYNLAGQLITSTTTCESVTSLDVDANHVVIVRVAGETHKVVL